jgi:anti-anti-sigma factor
MEMENGSTAMSHTATGHECQIATEMKGAVRVVHVSGRLDWSGAGSFRDRMRYEWVDGLLILDLRRLSGIDAAGTGVVLAAVARARHRGQHLAIVAMDPILIEVLSSLGSSSPVVHSPAEAWRVLSRAGQVGAAR